MDNKDFKKEISDLFTSIGALVEMWNVAYKEFKGIGYSDEDATRQTAALIQVMINGARGNGGHNE